MDIPTEYIIQKFYQYSGFPTYKKYTNVYNGSCPSCREGKSWGKKKRLFYMVNENYFYCQNCQRNWNPINWIMEQTGMSFSELLKDIKDFDSESDVIIKPTQEQNIVKNTSTLPEDSINLFDPQQIKFYQNNIVVQDCLKFIKRRRLDTAINRPKALFISLKDFIHKNRLCIPFYDEENQIQYYQTRAIYKKDEEYRPKYLSKINSNKTIFGIKNISSIIDYIFIFEGPIDAMFVKNAVAIGGISISDSQEKILEKFRFYKKIWVLDNQLENCNVKKKVTSLINCGETVFFWPKELKNFKDINELCIKYKKDEINPKFFIKYALEGIDALIRLNN